MRYLILSAIVFAWCIPEGPDEVDNRTTVERAADKVHDARWKAQNESDLEYGIHRVYGKD